MKKTIFVIMALAVVLALGCTPKLSESFDDVQESAPSVCKQYCEESTTCGWDADGPEADNAEQDAIDGCIVNCAWSINIGTYLITQECDLYDEDMEACLEWKDPEYAEAVGGSALQDLMECLMDADLYSCEDGQDGAPDHYEMMIENSGDCGDFGDCYAMIGVEGLPEYSWESDYDYCVSEYEDPEMMAYLAMSFY